MRATNWEGHIWGALFGGKFATKRVSCVLRISIRLPNVSQFVGKEKRWQATWKSESHREANGYLCDHCKEQRVV